MRTLSTLGFGLSALGFMAALAACGDDTGTGGGATGGGSTGGSGGGALPASCEGIDVSSCAVVLGPTADDTTALQTAFIETAKSGDTVCLCPGTYSLNNELQVDLTNLTLKGVGATRDDVVLDFAGQMGGDDGLTSTGDGFTVENLSVKNSPGNGIVVTGADTVTFRNLHVSWDDPDMTKHGAYAVYPVKCTNVLVEDSEIIGANDAGAYVGQSSNIIVRNNDVHGNVAGIEIENSTDAEVYGNKAYDNSGGILVFVLPNLEKKDGMNCDVHDNEIYDNNRANTGEGTVGKVPVGTGILVLGADNTQIHDNDIHDNNSLGLIVVSHKLMKFLDPGFKEDPMTDGYPDTTYVYGNTFTGNSTMQDPVLDVLQVAMLEDVVWDGVESTAGMGDVCLSMTPPTFRNLNGIANLANPAMHITDTTAYECDHTKLPAIVEWDHN